MANSRFSIAVHVLALLADLPNEDLASSDSLAQSVNTNPVVIRRLLRSLNEAGLIVSQTGAAGGSKLCRNPAEITLFDIFQAVRQGEIIGLPRQQPNQKCDVGRHIQHILGEVQASVDSVVERKLSQTTLRNVVEILREDCRAESRNEKRSEDLNIWLM